MYHLLVFENFTSALCYRSTKPDICDSICCILVDAEPGLFDFVIINDDLERAYNDFIKAVEEELAEFVSLKDVVKAVAAH